MKCEICKKNEAQFYYKESINGKTTEKHLCAECAHKSCDIRTDNLDSHFHFKRTQNSVVEERAALNDNSLAKLIGA